MLEKIALQKKIISEKDCRDAFEACRSSDNFENALKDYFITHNLIHPKTLEQLINTIGAIKIIKQNIKFGTIAVEMGFISDKTLAEALTRQKKVVANNQQPKLIGLILMDSGELTKEQTNLIVKEQNKRNLKVELIKKEDPSVPQKFDHPKPDPLLEKKDKAKESSETIQGGMILEIEENGMTAFLRKTNGFNNCLTADDILEILITKDIRYGIETQKAIEGFINSSGFKRNRFKIASGTPKVAGSNARIEYYFDTDHLNAGQVDEKGNIDFRARGEIPKIEAGTLLAEKFPYRESKNGRDIFGYEILTEPALDIPLKIETGAVLSEDQMKVYAEISGFPKLSWSGNISVIDNFVVKGDVGYETGHVSYEGNIEILGGLKSGFRISGFDIKISEIDGGEIYAQGDVTIINGVNNAKIYSRGHVNAKFIHTSEICCLGNVVVEKEIVDSHIESSGACRIQTGDIVNSTMGFNQGIYAKNIGTEKSSPNTIIIGQDLFIIKELLTIEGKIVALEKNRLSLEKRKDRLLSEKSDLHQTTTRMANELDKILEDKQKIENHITLLEKQPESKRDISVLADDAKQKEALFSRLDEELNALFNIIEQNEAKTIEIDDVCDDLEDQIDDLNQEKVNFTDWNTSNISKPVVVAEGKVYTGTLIKGTHVQKKIVETHSNVQIKESILQINDSNSNIYEIQIHDNTKRR